MVDARSARFQGQAPGSWGTSAPVSQRRTQPRQTEPPRPVEPTRKPATNIFGQPVDHDRNANVGRAIAGTVLNAFDVPVQAMGGMYRDAVQGRQTDGQSAGSRALQNYGQHVGDLFSDIGRPGPGQTPFFQPREFDAAGEAAVDRFGLEGAGASAARGGATVLDLLTGLAAGGASGVVGDVGRGVGRAAANMAPHLRKAAYVSDSPVVRDTLMGRHFGPTNISVKHPRDVPIVDGRTIGPGTYFTNTDGSAQRLRSTMPGDRSGEHSVALSYMDRYKLANSRGYAGADDVMESVKNLGLEDNFSRIEGGLPLHDAGFDNPIVENLLREGFVGFEPGKGRGFPTGEFTNWLVGADDIAGINSRLPQLGLQSGPADVNSIPRIESILRKIFPTQ